jgi:5-methylcytosine-specific restriction endonuclease McrA
MKNKRDFTDPQYEAFRKRVRARDSHTCQFPGCSTTKRLHVHHIIPWAKSPILRYVDTNGITLCSHHHKLVSKHEEHYQALFTGIVYRNKNKNG